MQSKAEQIGYIWTQVLPQQYLCSENIMFVDAK